MELTFGMQKPFQPDHTDTKEIRPMESELDVHQKEPTEAKGIRKLENESYTTFGEKEEEMKEVRRRAKQGRKKIGNGESRSDGHGRFTQTETLGLTKALVAIRKDAEKRRILSEGVRETCKIVCGMKNRSKHSLRYKWINVSKEC